MAHGDLKINNLDAYDVFGITFAQSSLSALMTPPPVKDRLTIESRLAHGITVVTNNPKLSARDVTLEFNLVARSEAEFWQKYNAFCKQLETGVLTIETKWQTSTVYRLIYLSCSQFSQYRRGMAKFSLKCKEPDPSNRAKATSSTTTTTVPAGGGISGTVDTGNGSISSETVM